MYAQLSFVLAAAVVVVLMLRGDLRLRLLALAFGVPLVAGGLVGGNRGGLVTVTLWMAVAVVCVGVCLLLGADRVEGLLSECDERLTARRGGSLERRRYTRLAQIAVDPNEAARLSGSWG